MPPPISFADLSTRQTMASRIFKTDEPVILEGYQAVFKPSVFGYTLSALISSELVDELEEDRAELLKWCESKLKNPKRSTLKPEPWEEMDDGSFKVKFKWEEANKPPIVDTEGTLITDTATPLYSGSLVKVAFRQKPYVMKDGVTYGTSLKLAGVQVISLSSSAGIDAGDLGEAEVAELFGKCNGFVASDPVVIPATPTSDPDDDF